MISIADKSNKHFCHLCTNKAQREVFEKTVQIDKQEQSCQFPIDAIAHILA